MASAMSFDRACSLSGMSNRQIARHMDVSETLVRKLRDGDTRVNLDHLRSLPPSVRAHIARELRPDVDPHDAKIDAAVIVLFDLVRARRGAP